MLLRSAAYEWKDPNTGWHCCTVLHYVVGEETWTDTEGEHQSTWACVSARPMSQANGVDRCNRMARHRWDIEEHMLTEKHYGYHSEHRYSQDWNGMQGFHALLRLVFALLQTAWGSSVLERGI